MSFPEGSTAALFGGGPRRGTTSERVDRAGEQQEQERPYAGRRDENGEGEGRHEEAPP
jgi:hypothetical protein